MGGLVCLADVVGKKDTCFLAFKSMVTWGKARTSRYDWTYEEGTNHAMKSFGGDPSHSH